MKIEAAVITVLERAGFAASPVFVTLANVDSVAGALEVVVYPPMAIIKPPISADEELEVVGELRVIGMVKLPLLVLADEIVVSGIKSLTAIVLLPMSTLDAPGNRLSTVPCMVIAGPSGLKVCDETMYSYKGAESWIRVCVGARN
jgi:hypothetical protein